MSHFFKLPDFFTPCPFPLVYHPFGDSVAASSDEWYRNAMVNFTPEDERKLSILMAGKLSAYVYNESDEKHLRSSCDLMQLIFHYGDLTDELGIAGNTTAANFMMNALWFPHSYEPICEDTGILRKEEPAISGLTRNFWQRCVKDAAPGFQDRFIEDMQLFLHARNIQAQHREAKVVPTLDEYIDIRRDSSGLKPLIDFLEYTLQIDLPEEVVMDPVMQSLKECVNDFATWSNDIFSFNKEQASGDTYNMVVILMKTEELELQDAINRVGEMCFQSLHNFLQYRKLIPSWGSIDQNVTRFIQGLENWIVACLHWSFLSGRYFGTKGQQIKESLIVELISSRRK
ncbi:hypothetical protein M422DRAFT_238521 [Sphaerobolus stellatus SS14]|nr:hypothetical protein M422DRAFT_238521 [Sphaerobolus stellatus SS14]